MKKLVLVLGLYRSGTSIVFDAFPDPKTYEPWPPFAGVDFSQDLVILKNPHHYDSDYLPCRIDRFKEEYGFDNVTVFWVVRDPYDTADSLRTALEYGPDIWPPPEGSNWIERAVDAWMSWQVEGYNEAQEHADNLHVVHYEDLFDPDALRTFCSQVGLATGVRPSDKWVRSIDLMQDGPTEHPNAYYWGKLSMEPRGSHMGRAERSSWRNHLQRAFKPYQFTIERWGYDLLEEL